MSLPRFMIAAPASGSGKTLVTCGVLQALVNRGLRVASFKCGPDYIDPMFHSRVIGARSKNLDAYFADEPTLRYLFGRTAETCDISVVEGVMGFYDGVSVLSTDASSYDVSEKLGIPVVLLLNCRGASISVLPTLKGFLEFRENNIRGVIFNNMSKRVYDTIAPEARRMGVEPIGYVPKVTDLVLESRHLGLVLPSEIDSLREKLHRLAGVLEQTLDIDALITMASEAGDLDHTEPEVPSIGRARIGLASDEAFCFTYEDNIDLLRRCGAEIVPFSPIHDPELPDVDAIVLSGGYPELHGEELEANGSMRRSIREALESGMPCMAECGGFMYLHERVEDSDGVMRDMCGFLRGEVRNTGKLTRFGYAEFTSCEGMLPAGTRVKGHEFHYWDSSDPGSDWSARKPSGREYGCIRDSGSVVAGFPHLYYYSNPGVPAAFIRRAVGYRDSKDQKR